MLDHFARIGVARAPWLDAEELKTKFLALSAEVHPDKAKPGARDAEAEFREINEAYNVLRHTRSRLLHLLEIEGTAKPSHVEALPPAALELFVPIGSVTKRADLLLKEKPAANSPMLKVRFFQKAIECVDVLQETQSVVQKRITEIESVIQRLNTSWRGSLVMLQQAAAALGFLERWNAQLQERSAALTF